MNPLLFSLNNVLLASELGNVDMEDVDYSCTWSVNHHRGGSRVEINPGSFMRQEWNEGVATWVPCQMLAQVAAVLEEQLQKQHEREQAEDAYNVREVARMRA